MRPVRLLQPRRRPQASVTDFHHLGIIVMFSQQMLAFKLHNFYNSQWAARVSIPAPWD
jgi:hypothetical protein